ncbi:MAG: hypothetical protein J6Y21_04910 [Clostridia bacterium]|nr:hypothetical protein [Clostridia bacterium]
MSKNASLNSFTGKPKRSPGKIILTIALVLLAVIILLAVVDRLFLPAENRDSGNTYGTADEGLKAIYRSAQIYLKETGNVKVKRYTKIARFIPEKTAVVCMTSSMDYFSQAEFEEIVRFVNKGGIFVFITNDEFLDFKYDSIFEAFKRNNAGVVIMEGRKQQLALGSVLGGNNAAYMIGGIDFPDGLISFDDGGDMVSMKYGEGLVILSASLDELRNFEMKSDRSFGAKLLVALKQLTEERNIDTVLFDEYYAGIQSDPVPDILGYGLVIALIELAVAAVVYFLSAGQRFGAPEKVGAEEKRNETEHISALAKLYKRTGSGSIGYKIHMETLMDDIADCAGMSRGSDIQDIADVAAEAGIVERGELKELLDLYFDADNIRFTDKSLDKYIQKMDKIRRERLQ